MPFFDPDEFDAWARNSANTSNVVGNTYGDAADYDRDGTVTDEELAQWEAENSGQRIEFDGTEGADDGAGDPAQGTTGSGKRNATNSDDNGSWFDGSSDAPHARPINHKNRALGADVDTDGDGIDDYHDDNENVLERIVGAAATGGCAGAACASPRRRATSAARRAGASPPPRCGWTTAARSGWPGAPRAACRPRRPARRRSWPGAIRTAVVW